MLRSPAAVTFCTALTLACGTAVLAQEPEHGLHAAATVGATRVAFDDERARGRFAFRIGIGYRFTMPGERFQAVRLTPGIALLATDVRGMDVGRDPYAFASLDLGVRVTWAGGRVRPWVEPGFSIRQTAERLDPRGRILNYVGRGGTMGFGVELPLTPGGRGVEIGLMVERGRFTAAEYQAVSESANVRHRGIAIQAGWSGRFTGISMPWR